MTEKLALERGRERGGEGVYIIHQIENTAGCYVCSNVSGRMSHRPTAMPSSYTRTATPPLRLIGQ